MKCNIVPLGKLLSPTFDVKFVNVENERVFAKISVPELYCNSIDCIYERHYPIILKNLKSNLVACPSETPNFWELNKNKAYDKSIAEYKNKRRKHAKLRVLKSESDLDVGFLKDAKFDENGVLKKKEYPTPLPNFSTRKEDMSALVDALLLDIYGPMGDKGRSESDCTFSSARPHPRNPHIQRFRLLLKSVKELRIVLLNLRSHISHVGSLLIRQLRRRDYLFAKRDKYYDVITAHLQALSNKRSEDTRMRFSLIPQPGESGFIQWLDAMKMVAKLQGGIPPEFRKRLWLTLAERHLAERGIDWKQAEKICFNEWSNPDDDELGIQIVKDLHRTGCSLFCGAAGRDNQAVLRRVLLGFARWNKSVGYCQGLNVLAALILQVVDRAESSAVKVMIFLVEGVLPEGYFADNLRGLSIDMAVFRDLLRVRLPKLSRHLEALQSDSKDKNVVGSNYEPPLTNVFTMQWFLTLFCHCLPQEAVLRVWDLIFLEGDEVLLRTALAIWEGLSDRIMPVTSADEFYSIMGVLTREMLEFTDTNYLIKRIVNMGTLYGVTSLREKHRYNITPWARRLSDDDDTDVEEDDRMAVEAMMNMSQKAKKNRSASPMGALLPSTDRERLALDISTLKQQYAKLRERQRQAHIILSAACARQTMVPSPSSPAMNHLLVGKTALVSGKARQIGPPHRMTNAAKAKSTPSVSKMQNREDKQGVTLHWKDMKKSKEVTIPDVKKQSEQSIDATSSEVTKMDSDSDSTSTELCDEPDRLSDLDSGDPSSTSECAWSPGASPQNLPDNLEFHDLTQRIDKLSTANDDFRTKCDDVQTTENVVNQLTNIEETIEVDISQCAVRENVNDESELDVETNKEQIIESGNDLVKDDLKDSIVDIDRKYVEKAEDELVGFVESRDIESDELKFDLKTYTSEIDSLTMLKTVDQTKSFKAETFVKIDETIQITETSFKDLNKSPLTTESDRVESYFKLEENKIDENQHQQTNESKEMINASKFSYESKDDDLYKMTDDNLTSDYIDRDFFERYEKAKTTIDNGFLGHYTSETNKESESDFSKSTFPYNEYEDTVTLDEQLNDRKSKERDSAFVAYDFSDSKLNLLKMTDVGRLSNKSQDRLDFGINSKYELEPLQQDKLNLDNAIIKIDPKVVEDKVLNENYSKSELKDDYQIGNESMKKDEVKDRLLLDKYDYASESATSKDDEFNSKWRYDDFDYKSTFSYKSDRLSEDNADYSTDSYLTRNKALFEETSAELKFSLETDTRLYTERNKSPESAKSYSSGETMGPDSKISTTTDLSPRTPVGLEGRTFQRDKSLGSPGSSESKTLTLRSVESEEAKLRKKQQDQMKMSSVEISSPWTTMSTDSLQNKSDTSPKLVVSASSSESYSPGKLKSSERSFSSDLQSPVSANSINYQCNYKNKDGVPSDSPSIETIAITSPFYPIAHPNQKTPSPYHTTTKPKPEDTMDLTSKPKIDGIDDSLKSSFYTPYSIEVTPHNYSHKYQPSSELPKHDYKYDDHYKNESTGKYISDEMTESFAEDDTLSPLPKESKFDILHRGKDERKLLVGLGTNKLYERSCSSLDKTLGNLKSSTSSEDLITKTVKKRSSDVLEDIRHLEANSQGGNKDTSSLTKNTGYIWQDVENLEARRQDTFSDSARSFSKESLNRPTISVSTEIRKTYIVEPKINIDDNSILKSIAKSHDKGEDEEDDRESKLGVWTKVKPRKKGENGRRSSDRALKIIQENSAILQKILTCQAKKRLPDLEAISKEITISPINEEISKIFSPILEKMGLNEHEINEELARINFKDFDQEVSTCGSEFDAKINDELSKLSIIDDNEEINHLALDDIIAEDYLNTREALIDRQINEELSKLLANCDGTEKAKERVRYFTYKSSESVASDLNSSAPRYSRELSPRSDIDIYHELNRLDLSHNHPLPSTSTIELAYNPSIPYTASKYSPRHEKPLSSPYDSYNLYNYNAKLSPTVTDNLTTLPVHKSPLECSYDFPNRDIPSLGYSTSMLTKETLEFRVRYEPEESTADKLIFPETEPYYKSTDDYTYESLNSYHTRKYDLTTPARYSYPSEDYDEDADVVSRLPGSFDSFSLNSKLSSYKDPSKRPVSHPEFPGNPSLTKYPDVPSRDSSAYRTSSLSLDNIGQKPVGNVDITPSPKSHFNPFPVRNTNKPKELALKLGLYSPTSPTTMGPLKRS